MENLRQNDHDVIIAMSERVKQTSEELKEIKEDIKSIKDVFLDKKLDVATAEKRWKNSNVVHKDHERRIRIVEKWFVKATGMTIIIQPIAAWIIYNVYIK